MKSIHYSMTKAVADIFGTSHKTYRAVCNKRVKTELATGKLEESTCYDCRVHQFEYLLGAEKLSGKNTLSWDEIKTKAVELAKSV
jgi:hypothetical protein